MKRIQTWLFIAPLATALCISLPACNKQDNSTVTASATTSFVFPTGMQIPVGLDSSATVSTAKVTSPAISVNNQIILNSSIDAARYIAQLPAQSLTAEDLANYDYYLVLSGTIKSGDYIIGLTKNGAWLEQHPFSLGDSNGAFSVTVKVNSAGNIQPILTAATHNGQHDIIVNKFSWVQVPKQKGAAQ